MNSCPNQPDKLLPGMGIDWNRCKSYPDQAISGVGKDSLNRKLFLVLKQAEMCIRPALCKKKPANHTSAGFVHFSKQSMHHSLIIYSPNASLDLPYIDKSGFTQSAWLLRSGGLSCFHRLRLDHRQHMAFPVQFQREALAENLGASRKRRQQALNRLGRVCRSVGDHELFK